MARSQIALSSTVLYNDAASTPDAQTLVIKYVGGTATINFSCASMMRDVALSILDAVPPIGSRNNSADASNAEDLLPVIYDDNEEKEEAKEKEDSSLSGSETETEDEDDAPKSPESSFESYSGHGLTQEINF